MNLRRFLPHIALVIGAVLFSAGLQTLAFTPPSSAPPTGDAYAPLTTSDVPQGKVAGLDLGAITTKGGAIINTVGGSWHGLIVENGNVGIGTTNPGTKLEVAGDTPIITLRSNTPAIKGSLLAGSSGGLTRVGLFSDGILAFGAGGGTKMTIDSNGNVGIGTTNPSVKLHIQDGNTGFLFKDSGSTSGYTTTFSEDNTGLKIGHNSGSRDIQFQTKSNTKMTIDVGGNVGIGTTNPGERLEVNGNVKASAFLYSSDINLKQNIQNIPNALQKIQQLNGVYFQWKESGKDGVGVIAQDIEKVFPELVATDPNTGLKSVSYGNLVAPLIEAIKEQQKQIDELKAEIEVLKGK